MAYSRDGFPHSLPAGLEESFFSAPINTGVPVLDQDVNIMQAISLNRSNQSMAQLYSCGWQSRGTLTNFGINNFEMLQSTVVCHDRVKVITDTGVVGSNIITVPTTVGRPAGQTFDLVFVEVFAGEVRDTDTIWKWGNVLNFDPGAITNNIIDPAVGLPAAVRMQDQYRIRTVAEASDMTVDPVTLQGKKVAPELPGNPLFNFTLDVLNAVYFIDTTAFSSIGVYDDFNGFVFAFPIALIERTVGDDDLINATVTDLREKVQHKVSAFANPGSGTGCEIEFNGQMVSPEVIDVVAADAVTIDFCDGNVHFVDLAPATGDVTITLLNPVAGGVYHISFKQAASPVQLIWPGDVDFVLGFPHLLSLVPGDIDVFHLIRTSNPSYRLFPMGPRMLSSIPPCQQDLTLVGAGPAVIDFAVCDSWRVFLATADVNFSVDFVNAQPGGVYSIKFVQGAVNHNQTTFIPTMYWLNKDNIQEGLTDQAFGTDLLTVYYDGTAFCAKLEGRFGDTLLHMGDVLDNDYVGKTGYILEVDPSEGFMKLISPAAGVTNLNSLTDVTLAGPINGEVLTFSGGTWINAPGAAGSLSGLSDTVITVPAIGNFLQYDGANWVDSASSAVVNGFNQGGGAGTAQVFISKSVVDFLDFRSLREGTNVTITQNATEITINASAGGEVNTLGSMPGGGAPLQGTKTGVQLRTKTIQVGSGLSFGTIDANQITLQKENPLNPQVWGAVNFGASATGTVLSVVASNSVASEPVIVTGSVTFNVNAGYSGLLQLKHGATIIGQQQTNPPGNGIIPVAVSGYIANPSAGATYNLVVVTLGGVLNQTQNRAITVTQAV